MVCPAKRAGTLRLYPRERAERKGNVGSMREGRLLAWVLLVTAIGLGCLRSPQELSREHKDRAQAWLEAGKLREASVEYQAALQKAPSDVEALFGLSHVLDLLGLQAESARILRRAIAAEPGHTAARLHLAEMSLRAGNYSEALGLARQVSGVHPDDAVAVRLEARALTALGERDEARLRWEAVLASPRADAAAYLDAAAMEVSARESRRAAELLREALEKFPRSGLLHAELGGILYAANPDEAAALFARAEALAPDEARVWMSQARTLVRQGFVDEGLGLLVQAQGAQTEPLRAADLARERARLLTELGELREAQAVLEEARERHPEHPGLAVTLADVLILQGRTAEARELVRFAAAFDPSGRLEKHLEARIYLEEGFPQWALQVTGELARQGDQSVETRLLHARASSHAENWAEALSTYRTLLAQVPEREEARIEYAALLAALGDHRGASVPLATLPPSDAEAPRLLYLRAKILLGQGDTAGARGLAVRLEDEQPGSPVVLTLLGDVERAAGNLDEALALYGRARELAPRAVEPLFAQAETMKAQGASLNEIIRVLEGHIAARGETSVVLNQIATYLLESGDLPRASQRVQRSLMVEPNDWRTVVLQARIDRAQGDDAKASVQLEHAIRLSPRSPEPYNRLAEIYEGRGEPERAERAYLRLLDVRPGEPQTCNNLANLYLEQGRLSEGVTLARQALEGAPGNPAILDTLGWALELAGSSDEAADFLKTAYERLPDHPEVLLHWGVNLRSRGKTAQAGAILSRVVEQAPETPYAERAAELLASCLAEGPR